MTHCSVFLWGRVWSDIAGALTRTREAALWALLLILVSPCVGQPRIPWALPDEYLIQAARAPRTEALQLIEAGFARFPNHLALAQAYGEHLLFEGRFSEAERAFLACARGRLNEAAQPCAREQCTLGLAIARMQLGKQSEARRALTQLAQEPGGHGWWARLYLARLATDEGRFAEALEALDALRPASLAGEEAVLLAEEGRVAWVRGDSDAALRLLAAAQSNNPRPEFQLLKVLILAWRGDIEAASQELTRVETENLPGIARRLPAILAQALRGEQDFELEMAQLTEFPREPGGWIAVSIGSILRGERDSAVETINRARASSGSPLFDSVPAALLQLRR